MNTEINTSVGRQHHILQALSAQGERSVESLARELGVSDMTVRRDLGALANAGRILRTHGGAVPAEQVMFHFEFLRRANEHATQKLRIAASATELIPDGSSVMLDSGTTTLAIARQLRERKRLTVITTSLPIASCLQARAGLEVLLLGGFLRHGSPDLGGGLTESNLENLHADLAFIGTEGIDAEGDVYSDSPEVGRMLARMATSADRAYIVADSSKIGRRALVRFSRISQYAALITDNGVPAAMRQMLKKAGGQLTIA